MFCQVCGVVDPDYDESEYVVHLGTSKHICNTILAEYKKEKRAFSRNRENIFILAGVEVFDDKGASLENISPTDKHNIRVYIKPNQRVKYLFDIRNDCKTDNILVVGIQLAHPQPQFQISDHPYVFGEEPYVWENETSLPGKISVEFAPLDIGQYEMPIMFTFHKPDINKNIIFVREMVVMVEENPVVHPYPKSPYMKGEMVQAQYRIPATIIVRSRKFHIPYYLKFILPRGLGEKALEGLKRSSNQEITDQVRKLIVGVRAVFDEGITKENYMSYFHHLLWWEEIICKINLRKYNMTSVTLEMKGGVVMMEVPGLAEKRPSLIRGDRVFLQAKHDSDYVYESVIQNIDDNYVHLASISSKFNARFSPEIEYDVRFVMSRVPIERCHEAVSCVYTSKQECRIFPEPRQSVLEVKTITKFYNPLIIDNEEQRSAVEHIVSGTSGKAPYIVFGPPGTGKTMTIVEAIVQLVVGNPKNRVLVCTDSNMAADHIAVMLLKFNEMLNIKHFIVRANSRCREWSVMPPELVPVSNGYSYNNFRTIDNNDISTYRIVVTTLLHAAKYAATNCLSLRSMKMTHLFIDEAAQAAEPNTLVPITALLSPTGQLVLAGDPKQLGPVCFSRDACNKGLGTSLLERLRLTYEDLYEKDPNYITMLVKNFRSDPDILMIPNDLFYNNELVAMAEKDPISKKSILGLPGGDHAIVFHAVHSREQRMGNAPSFFNEQELEMLKRYVKALIETLGVPPEDIGIIAPYIRQVYKMKAWLVSVNLNKIEVGTVEAFQGKEKRVILVSTVRANCRLLDFDAKYSLGFLVDDKRFNVTVTRAKAKLVIIGNPACLTRDLKWRVYMELCKSYGCYHGSEDQQLDRSTALLTEVARTRFDKCGLSVVLKDKIAENEANKKKDM